MQGVPDSKIDDYSHSTNFCSWNRLKEYLGPACLLKEGDEIIGLEVSDQGLGIKIKRA